MIASRWSVARLGGGGLPLLLCGVALLTNAAGAAAAPMLVATSPHFKIYSAEGEADLRARAAGLERYDVVLHSLTQTKDYGEIVPLTVYVVADQLALDAGPNVLGYYSDTAAGPFAVVPRKLWGVSVKGLPQIILYHEYAHHFLLQNFASLYSPWFVEGFAEFYSTAETDGATASVGRPEPLRIRSLMAERQVPLQKLLMPARPLGAEDTDALYARGWLLVHYLTLSKQRVGQIDTYLRIRGNGRTEEQAFQEAFGVPIATMDAELKTYFAPRRLAFISLDVPQAAAVTVREATPGETAVAKLMVRLRTLQQLAEHITAKSSVAAKLFFSRKSSQLAIDARAAGRKVPGDAAVQELIAEAELLAGETENAKASAEAALQLQPGNARANLVIAAAMVAAPGVDKNSRVAARKRIVAANRAAPNDPMPLIAYYRSFADGAEAVPAIAVQGLERAQQLAPQDDNVRVMLAREEIGRKHYEVASRLLRPVAYAPHDGPQRAAALAMLKELPGDHEAAPAITPVSPPEPIAASDTPRS